MNLTKEILKSIFKGTPIDIIIQFVSPLNSTIEKYAINTPARIASFLAQIGHESNGLITRMENLNYSTQGLLSTFKKYFDEASAQIYARHPERIANKVYASRMGNGDESSGDGWKYRGRGLIQITGHDNYSHLATDLNMKIEDAVVYLESVDGAAMSAGWFWDKNKLNPLADIEDIESITRKINGGLNGLEDRKRIYQLAKSVLIG